ncbi:hypothetical protein BDB01DRAFT_117211 [Pilobolus umbonatus]|nr:hypothetical protein BDB01DRAFT_117211 [Pilobolus umbonatus]
MSLKTTARKILSAQVKTRILMEEELKARGAQGMETEDFVYYDELEKHAAKEALKKKVKLDQYELPEINQADLLKREDPRIATTEELRNFIDEFAPSELNIDSETFSALPAEMQYEIIQDLKLKSRQTSWARLEEIIRNSPTALDFSKHQIKQLKHRNEMTQRVMQMNNMAGGVADIQTSRVAGERGRQYILYKNENIEEGLGWRLPGLSVNNPVNLDDNEKDQVKKEEKEDEKKKEAEQESEDKVKAAIASNPKLAALFADLSSDEEEEMAPITKNDNPVEDYSSEDDDQPLFLNNKVVPAEESLLDDINAYAYDEDEDTINDVIHRIYEDDYEKKEETVKNEDADEEWILRLDNEETYNLWLSRVPDAFVYLHSFNDEYKKILKVTIDEDDVNENKQSLLSLEKRYGKISERDELGRESHQFHKEFLQSIIRWKEFRSEQKQDIMDVFLQDESHDQSDMDSPLAITNKDKSAEKGDSTFEENSDVLIMDMDDEEQHIQFMEPISKHTGPPNINKETKEDTEIQLDISQSLFNGQRPLDNTTVETDSMTDNRISDPHPDDTTQNDTIAEANNNIITETTETDNNIITSESTLVQDQGYNSEDEMDDNLQGEDEEFARFVSDIASKNIDDVKNDLYQDIHALNQQQRKEKGNAEDITDQMIQDIQELLKLFGIPYIVSPMEAEAQCAELEQLKLVEGTVTDDSDVFLFGASRVYKNMFNQNKVVECYLSQDIEREMQLDRDKLIQLAYLLGSDYTEGIAGVGPVTAMEILAEFSEGAEDSVEGPLRAFRDWYNSGMDTTEFQRRFRSRHKDLEIPDDFPNSLVKEAYYHPTVDDSKQEFVWGHPQLDSLRIFLMEAFGWEEEKADQVLLPVLREMNTRAVEGEQQTLNSFIQSSISSNHHDVHKHSSKRVQNIVDMWRKNKKKRVGE